MSQMILYKYLAPSKLELLFQNKLLATPAKFLNDPLECYVRMQELTDDQWKVHFQQFEREGKKPPNYDQLPIETRWQMYLTANKSDEFASREPVDMRDRLSEAFGIVSLTEDPCHRLMWAHYTDIGKGVAVGFYTGEEQQSSGFIGRATDFGIAIKVAYNDTLTTLTQDFSNAALVFNTKHADWSYEQEWRVIRGLAEAEQVKDQANPVVTFYALGFRPQCLLRIVFGIATSRDDRLRIRGHFNSSDYPNLVFEEVFLDWRSFRLGLRPTQNQM
jgi:hypothetical protein